MTRQEGFSLVEVLIAAFLITVTLLLTASMVLLSHAMLGRGGTQTTAVTLSQQRIEWLRNQPYDSSPLSQGVTTEFLGGDYEGFTRTTTVLDDTPRSGVKQVTVSITSVTGQTSEVLALVAER